MSLKGLKEFLTAQLISSLGLLLPLVFLSLLYSSKLHAQLSDLHYLPPLKQESNNVGFQVQAIYLSTPETTAFNVKVYKGTGTTPIETISLSNTNYKIYALGNGDNNVTFVDNTNTGKVLSDSGLRFESENGERFYVNHRGAQASQGSSLTSKGRAALGKRFRWGGGPVINGDDTNATLGIMATEDNTTVEISGYDPSIVFREGSDVDAITDDRLSITLNRGQSYVLEYAIRNLPNWSASKTYDEWMGALIVADKDIAVSLGNAMYSPSNDGSRDIAIDQIIPENVLGNEYVFVRGYGNDDLEFAIIIATQNSTEIYVNDALTPFKTIDAGEYCIVPGSYYSGTGTTRKGENMYVRASKQVYAYHSTAGANSGANVDYNFIAPVNFLLDKEVDFIPAVNFLSTTKISGGVSIISAASATDAELEVYKNGSRVLEDNLPDLRKEVTGSELWVTYFLDGLEGNIRVRSTNSIAVGFMGQSGVIGASGYFSGFETIPSIDVTVTAVGDCLQANNGNVSLSAPQGYAIYQWYLEGNPVAGATQSTLVPTLPGSYTVGITQSADGKEYVSAPVDVSDCLPEIKLDVTSTKQTPVVNESITLRVNYKYQSFFNASNAEVALSIPSNFQITANSLSVGSWSDSTRKWTIGNVSPGAEEVLELTLKALNVGNPVTVSASNSQTVYGSDNTTLLNEGNNITDDLTEVFNIKDITVISATTPITKTVLDPDFSLSATSNNPNPISYTSSNEGIVRVASDGTVSIVSEGAAVITLSQLASSSYGPGTNTVTITVSKVTPTLSGFPNITKTYGDPNFQLTAPTSTGDGTFSYTSSDTSVATVNSSTGDITIKAAGSSTITATQAATSNYNTQSIQAVLTVDKADQVISVGSLPEGRTILQLVGPGGDNSPITVSATSTSGDHVTITATFDSSTSQTGTFSGNILSSVSGAGILMFDFAVSSNANYNAASTSVSLDVSKRPQNIVSASMPSTAVYQENLSIPLVASSPSSTAMVYTVVSGPATIVSGELAISGTGVITYAINNSGDSTYAIAPEVTKELEITQGTTTLSSFSISDKTYGDASFSIPIPTSNRTGTFVYSSSNPAVASIVGGNIQVNTPGTVTITATQPSTSNWTTGTITTTFDVLKATPVFTGSNALSKLTIDSDFNYPLTSSVPSNPIVYRSSDLSVATVNSSTGLISIEGIGTANITASQAATVNYNAASDTLALTVTKANPTLGALSNITKTIGDPGFSITPPTSDSGGTFSFSSSDNSVASIDATGAVTIVGVGSTTITFNQAPTAKYNSGSATLELTVSSRDLAFSTSTVIVNELTEEIPYSTFGLNQSGATYSVGGTKAGLFNVTSTGLQFKNPKRANRMIETSDISITLSASLTGYTSVTQAFTIQLTEVEDDDGIPAAVEQLALGKSDAHKNNRDNDDRPDRLQSSIAHTPFGKKALFDKGKAYGQNQSNPVPSASEMSVIWVGGKNGSGDPVPDENAKLTGIDMQPAPTVSGVRFGSDVMEFAIAGENGQTITDADTGRAGTQVRFFFEFGSDTQLKGDTYYKQVSGNWVPFMAANDGEDGAILTRDSNGYVTGMQVTITDNSQWDADSTVGVVKDPGVIGEAVGFTVSKSSVTVSETGTADSFTVVLDAAPTSDVVLSLTASDTTEATVSPSTLTFTSGNWNTPQMVTVSGVDDDIIDGTVSSTITVSVVDASSDDSYDSLADQTVTVSTTDNDTVTPPPSNPDSDGDGTPDSQDAFPNDPNEDTDTDGDGVGDNTDNCPNTANADQADLDGDGIGDACDPDIDGDGIPNDEDAFPYDPTEDTDTDGDGVGDNTDNCPNTANADQADLDGDGIGDVCDPDIDGDGIPNDEDAFPYDPTEDTDTDGDGVGDNADAFPNDPSEDTDSDGDGVGDNADPNPFEANAYDDTAAINLNEPIQVMVLDNDDFVAGADITLTHTGGTAKGTVSMDVTTGALTYMPLPEEAGTTVTVTYQVCHKTVCATATVTLEIEPDADGDGIGDSADPDDDNDGVEDIYDQCPGTPPGTAVDINGCALTTLGSSAFSVAATSVSCTNIDDGMLTLTATDTRYSYAVSVSGQTAFDLDAAAGYTRTLTGLPAGSYQVCFTPEELPEQQQCYTVTIGSPTPLQLSTQLIEDNKQLKLTLQGAASYTVELNGVATTHTGSSTELKLKTGLNRLRIYTDQECQGVIEREVFVSEVLEYAPNPVISSMQLYIGGTDREVTLTLSNLSGGVLFTQQVPVPASRIYSVDLGRYSQGTYILQAQGPTVNKTIKVIKR